MNNKEGSSFISVVHVIWVPYGIELFQRFITSYRKYSSGHSHELILLFNGVSKYEEVSPYLDFADSFGIAYKMHIYYGFCQDIDAYFWIADKLDSSYLLFVNSYSEFLAENWLEKYVMNIAPDVGMIGATGSWQSYYLTVFANNSWKWNRKKTLAENIRKYKLLLKAFFYWRYKFPAFPNPHIRTNAFFINRELLKSIHHGVLKNKFDAYKFESGQNSITRQIMRKGIDVVVIDRWGNKHRKDGWPASKTFWISEQENLLISDNQTNLFVTSDANARSKLTYLAWGQDNL